MNIIDIDIATLTRALPVSLQLPTLGGGSSFTVLNDGSSLEMVNSGNTRLALTDVILKCVYLRYLELTPSSRLNAGEYVQPNWPACPNTIFSPYIAKLIDYTLCN